MSRLPKFSAMQKFSAMPNFSAMAECPGARVSDFHALSFMAIPPDILAALDNRPFRFALQPVHHLIRMAHILSVSAFFGAIVVLDIRLMGFKPAVPLRALSSSILRWSVETFAVAMISGLLLFFYDPVHVGSHAYFTLKMVLIVVAMANAALFNLSGFSEALTTTGPMPARARIIGAISLIAWLGVMVCADLNAEAAPRLMLRSF